MNMVTEKIDQMVNKGIPKNNVRVTEIRLTIDNMVVLIFKFLLASLIVGVIIGLGIAVISFVSYSYLSDLLGM